MSKDEKVKLLVMLASGLAAQGESGEYYDEDRNFLTVNHELTEGGKIVRMMILTSDALSILQDIEKVVEEL